MRIVIAMAMSVMVLCASTAQAQRPARPPAARTTDAWKVESTRSEMTDELMVILSLDAVNKVQGTLFEVRPSLAVRCREGELAVIVSTSAVLDAEDDMTPVRLRWGTEPPEEERWSRSTDYTAAFAPNPELFLNELLNVPDLRFEFHPFDAAPRVAIFNARGLSRHIQTLRTACPSGEEPAAKPPEPEPAASPGRTPSDTEPYKEALVDERPTRLSGPTLNYPDLMRQSKMQGRVDVQAVIDTSGRAEPQSVKVLASTYAGFDLSAREYVLRSLFRPGRIHGRAVRVLVKIPIDYRLNGN